jgi:hypothetical protein
MRFKHAILLLFVLFTINLCVNSCKKVDTRKANIEALFTNSTWQLASVLVYNYVGGTQLPTDTLNTMCDSTQLFVFNSNGTCSYTNFDCLAQPKGTGTWTLSNDNVTLFSTVACKDTLKGGVINPNTSMPFATAKIVNLGQYSMILQTGDINTYYTPTTKRIIVQYGFIRQTKTGN